MPSRPVCDATTPPTCVVMIVGPAMLGRRHPSRGSSVGVFERWVAEDFVDVAGWWSGFGSFDGDEGGVGEDEEKQSVGCFPHDGAGGDVVDDEAAFVAETMVMST
jgi:hypothetical protein